MDATAAQARIHAALSKASATLLAERTVAGHWRGELSASALSTATAVVALSVCDREAHAALIRGGAQWLATHQNSDGGWGDTTRSHSNISTTALCWAAFSAARADGDFPPVVARAGAWLSHAAGSLEPERLAAAITARYGKDRTFSVPILMTLAIAGRLGSDGWRLIPALPFELAALPPQVFGAMQLPVVSYALPALIAIGQVIHHHAPSRNPLLRLIRRVARGRTLSVLDAIQPPNGGYLEATPLTSFVTMSLGAMGLGGHSVVQRALRFLKESARPDGSWPIDTDLATWVTTLSVKALAHQPQWASEEERNKICAWLLDQQFERLHPYTQAAPGGWAWTDLPGGVPDADDTAGALLALLKLGPVRGAVLRAGVAGCRWLIDLQNRDGGMPTFCRGWGALPFDRSTPDLTAHALRAWVGWMPHLSLALRHEAAQAVERGLLYLSRVQRADGAWLPLWFGNQHVTDDENPVYGTAMVLMALRELQDGGIEVPSAMCGAAAAWLERAQDAGGGWGGGAGAPVSVEETALAVEALVAFRPEAARAGALWLADRVEDGTWTQPAPVGFYFAKLWYFERLYPQLFTVGALGRAEALQLRPGDHGG